jgi:hypothetical protein
MSDRSLERVAQRIGAAQGLGQQQAALQRG